MKYLLALLCLLFTSIPFFGQTTEFETYSNGLIYNESTMSKLKQIADSLQLEFETIPMKQTYYSKYQAEGYFIDMVQSPNIEEDMKNDMPFDTLRKKYNIYRGRIKQVITKSLYKDDQQNDMVKFSSLHGRREIRFQRKPKMYNTKLQGKWLSIIHSASIPKYYSTKFFCFSDMIEGIYFLTEFEKPVLPEKYARMVQYADFMIDTTTIKFAKNTPHSNAYLPQNYEELSKNKQEELLKKFRNTKVVGFSREDTRPRTHALNIAKLSAQTANLGVFLRAHLDIVNDRFDIISGGGYDWDARKTYIRELEDLDINVLNLIIGIALRLENPDKNHYYGTIWRLGRALAETKHRKETEAQLLSMIQDEELDDYNRLMGCFLLFNYCRFTENESEKKASLKKFRKTIEKLPEYLSKEIPWSELEEEEY